MSGPVQLELQLPFDFDSLKFPDALLTRLLELNKGHDGGPLTKTELEEFTGLCLLRATLWRLRLRMDQRLWTGGRQERYLTSRSLRDRLLSAGHRISEYDARPDGTDVGRFDADEFVIAVEPDPPLDRGPHYFTFRREYVPEDLVVDPDFLPLPPVYQTALRDYPTQMDFVSGPMRWLLHRLQRFPQFLLWPSNYSLRHYADGKLEEVFEELPRLRPLHPMATPAGETPGAIVLDQSREDDAVLLWLIGECVAKNVIDFFVSDPDATEVYMIHHHDEVIVHIPDQDRRRQMLDNLIRQCPPLLDCRDMPSSAPAEGPF